LYAVHLIIATNFGTLEHILPQWLASEIEMPNVQLKHFRHDEDKPENELLRSHGLNTFTTRQVCAGCFR